MRLRPGATANPVQFGLPRFKCLLSLPHGGELLNDELATRIVDCDNARAGTRNFVACPHQGDHEAQRREFMVRAEGKQADGVTILIHVVDPTQRGGCAQTPVDRTDSQP